MRLPVPLSLIVVPEQTYVPLNEIAIFCCPVVALVVTVPVPDSVPVQPVGLIVKLKVFPLTEPVVEPVPLKLE